MKIFFNSDDFDPRQFYKLLQFCKENSLYVSANYLNGNSGLPQINIRINKTFAYTDEQIDDICNFIENYINDITGLSNASCVWGDVAGTEKVELRAKYYNYTSVGPHGDLREAEEWAANNAQLIEQINSSIGDAITTNFPYVKKCVIEPWVQVHSDP